jgi:hypothetical protein
MAIVDSMRYPLPNQITGLPEDPLTNRPDDGLNRQRYMTMHTSYLLLFPAQETLIGAVPAHLFTVHTDAQRFEALAEGATDVTGDPLHESRWDHGCAAGDYETDYAVESNLYH